MTKAAEKFRERQRAAFAAIASTQPVSQDEATAAARQEAIDRATVGTPVGNTTGTAKAAPPTSVMLKSIGITSLDLGRFA